MNKCAWYRLQFFRIALLVTFNFCCTTVTAQDTLSLTIQDAEKIFLQNNLSLLATKFNIDANRALVRQAKLWDNPVLSTDQNIYDQQGGFFKHDNNSGQVYIQVMQLIKTAGKRNKLAQLAQDNTTLSSEQFDDLLRTLRYTLVSDLFEIDHQLKLKRVYDSEIGQFQKLVAGMDAQLKAGNVSVKDNMRVRALLFSLQNELVSIEATIIPVESEIKLLLKNSDSVFIKPLFNYYLPDLIKTVLPSKQQLIQTAIENRPDAKIAKTQLDYQNHNLIYQKALVKPDINIGTEYDQRSSYAPQYVGLAISLPLNILNRNQGNISSAKYSIKQQEVIVDGALAKVSSDVSAAYDKIKFYQQVNNPQQLDFSKQYDALFQNMLNSYQQRQVNLLEFIDFTDAYKDSKLKLLDQHTALIRSLLELNYQVGKDVIIINK
jgi:cobalt-zinc-cadmium efflux system outer membrane protein